VKRYAQACGGFAFDARFAADPEQVGNEISIPQLLHDRQGGVDVPARAAASDREADRAWFAARFRHP
jgi:hypothetical protein